MIALFFYILAVFSVVAALSVLLSKKIIYSAFSLLVVLLCVAGIYVLMAADFLAITQLVVYIGGVLTLLIFGVMFTRSPEAFQPTFTKFGKVKGIMMSIAFFSAIFSIIWQMNKSALPTSSIPISYQNSSIRAIGQLLMTDFILPFELAALLLLMALVGATFVAGNNAEEE